MTPMRYEVLGEQHQPIGMLKRDCVEAIRKLKAGFTARMAIVEADFAVRLRQQDDRIQFVLWMLGIVILMQVGVLGMLFRLLS